MIPDDAVSAASDGLYRRRVLCVDLEGITDDVVPHVFATVNRNPRGFDVERFSVFHDSVFMFERKVFCERNSVGGGRSECVVQCRLDYVYKGRKRSVGAFAFRDVREQVEWLLLLKMANEEATIAIRSCFEIQILKIQILGGPSIVRSKSMKDQTINNSILPFYVLPFPFLTFHGRNLIYSSLSKIVNY